MGTVVGLFIHPLKVDVLACAIGKHPLPNEIHLLATGCHQGQEEDVPEAVVVVTIGWLSRPLLRVRLGVYS